MSETTIKCGECFKTVAKVDGDVLVIRSRHHDGDHNVWHETRIPLHMLLGASATAFDVIRQQG